MPELPDIRLDLLAQHAMGEGFLRVVRRRLRVNYPDGSPSREAEYDEVERRCLDAVVLLAHFRQGGERFVFLRSALRPPLLYRRNYLPELGSPQAGLWELPAGLVERDEESAVGLQRCAARELKEELGFEVTSGALRALGPSTFPSPGVLAERHFFFEIEVDPGSRSEPSLDGSALEHGGVVLPVRLGEALAWCQSAVIEDAKTELGLRRFAERMP